MKKITAAAILAFALAMEVSGQGARQGESSGGAMSGGEAVCARRCQRQGESAGGAMLSGEAAIRGGYGHTDPYKANLKFIVASRTIDFKSYAGVIGVTP